MINEKVLKKFEFDLRFKQSPILYRVTKTKDLKLLYYVITKVFKFPTNSAYIEFLLEGYYKDIDCIFLIDFENKRSDVFATSYYPNRKRQCNLPDLENIPDYIKEIL